MAGYLGYALKAGVEGFKTGFGMGQQKSEMEWQKKQRKKLEEKELKIKEGAALYNSLVSQVFADNVASEDEMMKLNTAFLAASYEVKAVIKDTHNAIQAMDKNKLEQDLAWLDLFADLTEGLDPKDIQGAFDTIKANIKSEKGLNLFEAYGNLQTKRYEVTKKEKELETTKLLPEEYRYPHLKEIGAVGEITPTVKPEKISAADAKLNFAISSYNAGKISFDELSKYMGTYIAPEKMSAKRQEVELMKEYGATDEEIKNKLLGIGEAKVTPEGEISAGEKRTFDMASSVMFGSSDWVTGISKPGIISQKISGELNMGQPLTEEENTEVRNNYNAIKDTIPAEIRTVIESQLQRYGISLEAPAPITPEPIPVKEPSLIEKGIEGVKGWLGKKGTEKDYTNMSEEELYNLAMAGDKLAYEEAKRRGLIK